MLDALVDAVYLMLLIATVVLYIPFQWWCWSQIVRGLDRKPPDITDGMPKWVARRVAARRTPDTASDRRPELLALPPAPPSSEDGG